MHYLLFYEKVPDLRRTRNCRFNIPRIARICWRRFPAAIYCSEGRLPNPSTAITCCCFGPIPPTRSTPLRRPTPYVISGLSISGTFGPGRQSSVPVRSSCNDSAAIFVTPVHGEPRHL